MIKRLHQAMSTLLAYLIFIYIFKVDKLSSIILSLIIGFISVLPDIDYNIYNWAYKQYKYLENKKIKYLIYPYYLFLWILVNLFKHRGFTHSIFPILIFFILGFFTIHLFYLFSIAFLLHIFEDSFTVSGIYPLYPIKDYQFKIGILSNNRNRNAQIVLSYIFWIIYIFLIFIY
ncbi:MAG: metal-dependent hydrolase [Nanopusillaceae archaeon]